MNAPIAHGKQITLEIGSTLYHALESIAQKERRSVTQAALFLLEESLRQRGGDLPSDDVPALEISALARAGGAFDWLADEPDLYDDACGEPA